MLDITNYLEFIESKKKSHILSGLKSLAKELNIPILALSQMSRGVETRTNKRPQLSDLRESGALEQDADMVIFIHRPEYYGIESYENGDSTKDSAEIIIAKHRSGGLADIPVKYIPERFKFLSLNEAEILPKKKSLINSVESNFEINLNSGELTPF